MDAGRSADRLALTSDHLGVLVRRATLAVLLLGYTAAVIGVTMFPIEPHPPSYWAAEPWWTMIHYIPFAVDAPSFLLNIVMFLPFGILVPLRWPRADSIGGCSDIRRQLRWPRADSYRRLFGYSAAVSSTIELSQLIMGLTIGSRRTVDINDLISNVTGALVGLVALRLAVPDPAHRAPAPDRIDSPEPSAR